MKLHLVASENSLGTWLFSSNSSWKHEKNSSLSHSGKYSEKSENLAVKLDFSKVCLLSWY